MGSLDFNNFFKKSNTLHDVLGVHISSEHIVMLRLRSVAESVTVTDAEIFDYDYIVKEKGGCITGRLPIYLKPKYAAVACESESSIIKLLNFPHVIASRNMDQLATDLGVSEPEKYRLGELTVPTDNKTESSFIEVALPLGKISQVNEFFSMHVPAASSITLAHLSAINAFGDFLKKSAFGGVSAVINIGVDNTSLFVFNNFKIIFLRMFNTGMKSMMEEISRLMGISKTSVRGIICENAFDVSKQVETTLKPFAHKINLSLDFVERKEQTVIEKVYLTGSSGIIAELVKDFQNFLMPEVNIFDPFKFYNVGEDAFKNFDERRWRYTTALGAALGLLGDK